MLARIKGDYERDYYAGIIWERLGNARAREGSSEAAAGTYHTLLAAMDHYEKAIEIAPPGNDDAILRWNTCARTIMQNQDIQALPDESPADAWLRDEAGSRIADA